MALIIPSPTVFRTVERSKKRIETAERKPSSAAKRPSLSGNLGEGPRSGEVTGSIPSLGPHSPTSLSSCAPSHLSPCLSTSLQEMGTTWGFTAEGSPDRTTVPPQGRVRRVGLPLTSPSQRISSRGDLPPVGPHSRCGMKGWTGTPWRTPTPGTPFYASLRFSS